MGAAAVPYRPLCHRPYRVVHGVRGAGNGAGPARL